MGYYKKLRNQNKKVTILDVIVGIPFAIFLYMIAGVWWILESVYKFFINIFKELK